MPSKKKTKRKPKSATAKKKSTTKKKPVKAKRSKASPSKASPKKSTAKKATSPARGRAERRKSVSAERELKQEIRGRRPPGSETALGRQSGDLQGLSRAEQADSESVEELVEEGNISEAGAVAGVEASDNEEEKEVRTRELPEDDVPEEYIDEE
jgi:hypothetical protein